MIALNLKYYFSASLLIGLNGLYTPVWAKSVVNYQKDSVVAYFSQRSEGKSTTAATPQENGYYRVYLGQDAKGYWVQDFYQNTKTKQSDPFQLKDVEDIPSSASRSMFGSIKEYYASGAVVNDLRLDSGGNFLSVKSYRPNGKILSEYLHDSETDHVQVKYWYNNRIRALDMELQGDEIVRYQAWRDNAQAIPKAVCFINKSLESRRVDDECMRLYLKLSGEYAELGNHQYRY